MENNTPKLNLHNKVLKEKNIKFPLVVQISLFVFKKSKHIKFLVLIMLQELVKSYFFYFLL